MSTPLPPADLHARDPELVVLPADADLHRFYTATYDPIYFDRSQLGRFNAPDASYGVLYGAQEVAGAFAETFLRTPRNTLIDADFLGRKGYVRLRTTRELRLVKLTGSGLARIGATAEVPHRGLPYDTPQAWSKALAAHPIDADGIAYLARHDDSQLCFAIFDRAGAALSEVERRIDLDMDWFWEIAMRYRVGLAP
ncbi:RES family NAD+ phosphorylase [Xanthobacter sp. DSM 24535]|uniref:RES family NAD+ phosphorylase n=1 Tax=Roseixanthobacter psychrophilus TaxID=3119917 RepID=UPI0037276083